MGLKWDFLKELQLAIPVVAGGTLANVLLAIAAWGQTEATPPIITFGESLSTTDTIASQVAPEQTPVFRELPLANPAIDTIIQAQTIEVGEPEDSNTGFFFTPSSGLPRPSALRGATRFRTVAAISDRRSGFQAIVNFRQQFSPTESLLLDVVGGETILGADLSYLNATRDPRQGFGVNITTDRARSGNLRGGDREVNLSNGEEPWIHRTGGGVEWLQPLGRQTDGALGLSYQNVSIRDDVFSGEREAEDELGNRLTASDTGEDDLLTLNFVARYDSSDSAINPSQGTRIRVGTDQYIPIGEANLFLNRLSGNVTQFVPVDWLNLDDGVQTLVFNLQAGTMVGDAPPPSEAFALGGSSSVRGYRRGGIGTGRSFLQATAEYRFPLFDFEAFDAGIDVGGMFFADYATDLGTGDNVIGQPAEVRDKPGDGFGLGFGLRLITPFGPARLEVGFSDQGDSEVFFGIGDRF
jgi:outer membrane protein insertion porin family